MLTLGHDESPSSASSYLVMGPRLAVLSRSESPLPLLPVPVAAVPVTEMFFSHFLVNLQNYLLK